MEADDGNQTDDSAETEDGHENVALAFGEVEGFCDGEGEEGGCYVGCYVEGGVEEPFFFVNFFLILSYHQREDIEERERERKR